MSKLEATLPADLRKLPERIHRVHEELADRRWFRVVEELYLEFKEDRVAGLAAELAYRFFLASFPFLIFLATMTGYLASVLNVQNPTDEIMSLIGSSLPDDASNVLRGEMEHALNGRSATLLSLSMLGAIWTASGGISTVMSHVNMAFDVRENREFWKRYPMAIALTIGGGLTVVLAMILSVVGQVYGYRIADEVGLSGPAGSLLPLVRYPVVVVLVLAAVTTLYWLSPAVRLPLRWMLPGALLFLVVWIGASFVYGIYVSGFASYGAIYGALGGIVITLIWFYLTAMVLLFGAEVNAVVLREWAPDLLPADQLEGQRRDRRSKPESETKQAP